MINSHGLGSILLLTSGAGVKSNRFNEEDRPIQIVNPIELHCIAVILRTPSYRLHFYV